MTDSRSQPITGHTPTPWRLKTSGNTGNAIEADSGKRYGELNDGFRIVASYQECCASDKYHEQLANCHANGALIVEAVNNYERLTERCSAYKGQVEAGAAEIAALKARVAELEAALQFIADGYENHDVSHVDYRVKVYQVALDALQKDNSHG